LVIAKSFLMEDKVKKISDLIVKFVRSELSETEKAALETWINFSEQNRSSFEEITNGRLLMDDLHAWQNAGIEANEAWQKLVEAGLPVANGKSKLITIRWWKYAVAAALLVCTSLTAYFFLFRTNGGQKSVTDTQVQPVPATNNDVPPGGNKAILTLSNGATIVLDNVQNGTVAVEGNSKITKHEGALSYKLNTGYNEAKLMYNTLRTPATGIYQLTLPDRTKVWLNAVSSIRYPVAFTGRERNVEITGEAYFEVAHNGKPFIVTIPAHSGQSDGSTIEVLGTHFNVMAYPDEASIRTTLIEGSVKVTKGDQQVIMKPAEQTDVASDGIHVAGNVDIEQAIAWKNGVFKFNGTDLKTIMRQLARWYDVQVVYQTNITRRYRGEVPRDVNLSEVLSVLEYTGAHFKIEGKKITVMP
jgi:transmembrane sensor